MTAVRRPPADWETRAARVLEGFGTAPVAARSVARALVAAERDGLPSHGLSRLQSYGPQVPTGKVRGDAEPTVERLGASGARVDAHEGFAFPALDLAVDTVADLADPVAAVAVTNSHHFGVAGYHAERLAERGLVGLVLGNSPAAIVPWGGSRALFGTNPIAFAFPREGTDPLVIDLSLSKQARGKVVLAAKEGRSIPEGWALDAAGRPTTDPKAALEGGSMVPMGDAKGAALVLAVEVMAAALTGASFGFEASSFFTAEGDPPRVGQVLVGFRPGPFSGGTFAERAEALFAAVEEQDGARLPGARRIAARAAADAEGIAVGEELAAWIEEHAG